MYSLTYFESLFFFLLIPFRTLDHRVILPLPGCEAGAGAGAGAGSRSTTLWLLSSLLWRSESAFNVFFRDFFFLPLRLHVVGFGLGFESEILCGLFISFISNEGAFFSLISFECELSFTLLELIIPLSKRPYFLRIDFKLAPVAF